MRKPLLEKLIQEIVMFDMHAGFTLYCRRGSEDHGDKDNLYDVMDWSETPEGYKHWNIIYEKLAARRKNYHPHRDLMIEYANDKTIEFEYLRVDGSWNKCAGYPSFNIKDEYRKKPKVTKKVIEYRIYLDQENEIHLVEKIDLLIDPSHFKKWLTGWQKFEIEVE